MDGDILKGSVHDRSSENQNERPEELETSIPRHSSDAELRPQTPTDIEKQSPKQTQEPDLVAWDGLNDPENPAGWSFKRKLFVSGVLVSLPLIVNVGTSILSAAGVFIAKEYHVGSEVTVLTTSLFLMVCFHQSRLIAAAIMTLLMVMQRGLHSDP